MAHVEPAKIKLCGLRCEADIRAVNELCPDYIGFVFAKKSRRCVTPEEAKTLKYMLNPGISAVGVFVDEEPGAVAELLASGVIDMAQLHGSEDEEYIRILRGKTDKPLIRAYRIGRKEDVSAAENTSADYLLLDAGAGDGRTFDWEWLTDISRPYFLAGGLTPENVAGAVAMVRPFAVDVSSGIETNGGKDMKKMKAFVTEVRRVKIDG